MNDKSNIKVKIVKYSEDVILVFVVLEMKGPQGHSSYCDSVIHTSTGKNGDPMSYSRYFLHTGILVTVVKNVRLE